MNLGTKGRYAVMAMVDISTHYQSSNRPVCLKDVAARQNITVAYLEQLLARIKAAQLVNSVRGPGGGYIPAKSLDDIKVSDIIDAVDESTKMTRCSSHDAGGCAPNNTKCVTHHLWEGLENHISEYLSSYSLQDVCKQVQA